MATAPPAPAAPGGPEGLSVAPSGGAAEAAHAPSVGLAQGAALYIAAVLGTGILVLPALAADAAGPGSILAVIALIGLSVPLAGTFAALAARHPDAGGVATFVALALGPTAARMAGYWFFFGVTVGAPVVGLLGAEYVVAVLGIERWVALVVAPVLLALPFVSNLFGLRFSGKAQLVLSGLLVVIVVGVIVVAAPASDSSNFTPVLPHGWAGVGLAVSLFVWAFAGWEAVTHIAGEFRRPRRTIPLATAIAIVVVGASYLGLQVVTVGVLGDRAGASAVPLLDLVARTAPAWGKYVVASIAGIVALGVLNTYVAALAKLGASLGRDRHLPHWFGKGAEAGGVPRRALALVALIVAAYFTAFVVTGGDLKPFILIHTSSMVAVYALGVVAALRLLPRFGVGWWLAAVSTVLVAGLLLLAGANLLVPLVLAVAAVLVTLVQRVRATRPTR
ncbi:amino acid permease [Herbiconiux sp. P17]|uniref:amino acid permease n=1 Tax=Herbiconiux wuyangfengii TaxID=3342794 RepID=UPI0035BAEE82